MKKVPARELLANPKNWRVHPTAQRSALNEVLEQVGFADALLARETKDGLELIDGHLRQDVAGDQEVPVLVLDLTDDEADVVLATHDPIAAMAKAQSSRLDELLAGLKIEGKKLPALLGELAKKARGKLPDPPGDFPEFDGDIPTDHRCPKCGYEWSGKAK